jgi:hypothetical protein
MNLLYPKIPLRCWPAMLGVAAIGALVAGLYGIVHDEVTYSISPEYFTRMKFRQFHYADFGWPERVFVAEIGFLASWRVGFFAGWVLARVMAGNVEPKRMLPLAARGFGFVIAFAIAGFASALVPKIDVSRSGLAAFADSLGVSDLPAFVRVAYIHNATYLGGLLGTIVAAMVLRRKVCRLS